MTDARRVTIYLAGDGWRYKVQASNWRTIDAGAVGVARRSTVERRIAKQYPDVETIIQSQRARA